MSDEKIILVIDDLRAVWITEGELTSNYHVKVNGEVVPEGAFNERIFEYSLKGLERAKIYIEGMLEHRLSLIREKINNG